MALPPLNSTFNLDRSIQQARDLALDLQRQLASGKKSTSYGGLGSARIQSMSFRAELSQIEGYKKTTDLISIRLETAKLAVGRINDIASTVRTDALGNDFNIQAGGQTYFQSAVHAQFTDLVTILNTEVAGRHLFGGRDTEQNPVEPPEDILNGRGAQAGFKQIVSERRLADLGADGRGRLVVSSAASPNVDLDEDSVSPFGFKINSVYSTLNGTTVTGPAGSPSELDITFSATLPNGGETIRISLDLPDGTTTDLVLTARSASPTAPGEFQIGADEIETAGNFESALKSALQTAAARDLSAASAFAAAEDFFDFDSSTPPQRVDGPPFETATALRDGTTDDTIFFYQGEISSSPARDSAIAKVDDTVYVSYGMRANEEAFRTVLKSLAVLSVETFDPADADAKDRYSELRLRANQNLGFQPGTQSVSQIVADITVAQQVAGDAAERHMVSAGLLETFVADIEDADIYEVSSQLLSMQNRLEASLRVTAVLGQIKLINYL